jgi:glycosyltransferase involved in cell wall biosynthesis
VKRPIAVLELRSVWGTGGGPEKTILLGAGLHDPSEFAVTVCYIRDLRDGVFAIGERARRFGVDYVELPERHSFDFRIWGALKDMVRRKRIDIVHAHDHKTDLLAFLLSRRLPVRALATSHGWSGYSLRERLLYYPADSKVLARFPQVIAVSSAIRDTLARRGVRPERLTVLLNSIDPHAFRRDRQREAGVRQSLGLPASAPIVGAVGRLERVKRFDRLLDAFATVAATHDHLHLAIVGEGSLRDSLERQAEQLGLAGRCHLLGHLDDIALVHHAFDVLVQSSESEGTPNAVLEAMAMETPLVATDVGGTRELASPGVHGLIVPPNAGAALATALAAVLDDPAGARRRADAARRRIETDLSFDTRTRRLEAIYRGLAEPSAAPAARTAHPHAHA